MKEEATGIEGDGPRNSLIALDSITPIFNHKNNGSHTQ
jgi:hypothetical protein